MSIYKKISFILYLCAIVSGFICGLLYLFSNEFMPYHSMAVGLPWHGVNREFQILILALLKTTGGGWIGSSIAMGILLFIPFKNNERWANWTISVIGLCVSLSILAATVIIKYNTPANPPLVHNLITASIIVIALITGTIGINVENKSK